jgi:hypothetical protein
MKKLLLLILGFMTLAVSSFAQTTGKISGALFDEKQQALSFSNIFLLKGADSTIFKAGLADENGKFVFDEVPNGKYLVSATMVGYDKFISPLVVISDENKTIDLKTISLQPSSATLEAVQVVAKKPLLEQHADKLVMNVENSIVSAGGTALEVLQRAPGVSIDQNDNISLKGKQGVQIYMDGKPTYMTQEQLANLLKNMPSDQIEKIELITNPSSRYDAAGNSGIINIITKRNKNFGTNGSLTLGGGMSLIPSELTDYFSGVMPKYNVNLNLNNRQGKFNTFGNVSFREGQNYGRNDFYRWLDGKEFDQYSLRYNESRNVGVRVGTDYFATKKTTIGVLINANVGRWQSKSPVENNTIISTSEGIESSLFTLSSPRQQWTNLTFNTNFKHAFNDKGKELTADIDYSVYDNNNGERGMVTNFFDAAGKPVGNELTVTSRIPNKYNILAAKADYILPLSESNAKFEFGAKVSFVKSDNNIQFFNDDVIDKGRSNHFIYTENINAAYINFNKKFNDKWNLQTGLRAENTLSKGESKTFKESKDRNYTNLFPSFYLTHVANEKNTFNFNYSRRIDRPDYQSLNPFIFFLDPYTYELGNEKLRAQLTDAVELSHTFKGSIITSLGYSFTNDYTNQVVKNAVNEPEILKRLEEYNNAPGVIIPENVSFAMRENIGTRQNINMSVSFPVKVNKWWSMNNNATAFYNIFKGQLMGDELDVKNLSYNFFTSQNFTMKRGWSGEASMWYNSKGIDGTFVGQAIYAINAGVAKSLWDKKGTFRLTVNDVFATARWRGETNFGGVRMTIANRWDSRGIRASLVYRFGNQNVKGARNRQTATSAEQNRVGGQGN